MFRCVLDNLTPPRADLQTKRKDERMKALEQAGAILSAISDIFMAGESIGQSYYMLGILAECAGEKVEEALTELEKK